MLLCGCSGNRVSVFVATPRLPLLKEGLADNNAAGPFFMPLRLLYIIAYYEMVCYSRHKHIDVCLQTDKKKGGGMDLTTYKNFPAKIQIADIYKSYVSFLDASPRTAQTYTTNIKQFIKWTQQNGIQHPTRQDVIAYRDELRERCKPSTVQGYITALRLFFRWTAQAGIYPNIAEHVKGAKLDSSHKRDYLTASQIKSILDSIDTTSLKGKRDYSIIALMVTGGLRDVEIARANTDDLRQLGNSTVLYLQGKGRDERTEFIKVVPAVEQPLRKYLSTRRCGKGKQPLFASLSNNNRGHRLTPKSISSIVKDRLIRAGFNSDRLTAHSLRHSAVTISLIGGLPLDEVQQFARHKNICTTQVYAHNLDRAKNRSADIIAKSIFTGVM